MICEKLLIRGAEAVEKAEAPAEPETTEVTIETEKTAEPTEEVKTEE